MMSQKFANEQQEHRDALVAMFESDILLLKQDLPFQQGHEEKSGNFLQRTFRRYHLG